MKMIGNCPQLFKYGTPQCNGFAIKAALLASSLILPLSFSTECYVCFYTESPEDRNITEADSTACLDPKKSNLQPTLCKGDQYCIKGSYTNSLSGREMYRRCETKFEKGCKLLPKSNATQILPNGTHTTVTYTNEYVCVCEADTCNSEPGAVVKRATTHNDTDFEEGASSFVQSNPKLVILAFFFGLFVPKPTPNFPF